jgi:hypothetical protein
LAYIKERGLDSRYRIIVDTSCYEAQMSLLHSIEYEQMAGPEMEKRFGKFGNFILIDSTGKKTEFMTDMSLKEFLQ